MIKYLFVTIFFITISVKSQVPDANSVMVISSATTAEIQEIT